LRLYIIRHAEPDYENNTITKKGHLEAKALAKRLKGEGITRIYSSPLGRAVHTATYTAEATGLKIRIEPWTHELSVLKTETLKRWGPLMAWDLPGEVMRLKREHLTHNAWHKIPLLGDKKFRAEVKRVQNDSDSFLKWHGYERQGGRYRVRKASRERIAIFCHGGSGLTWLSHLLEIPLPLMWTGFWMAPSSFSTVLFDMRSKEWAVPRCIGFCDVSHLYGEKLKISSHGIKTNFD
jgi:probable phosphoglycerate mutase